MDKNLSFVQVNPGIEIDERLTKSQGCMAMESGFRCSQRPVSLGTQQESNAASGLDRRPGNLHERLGLHVEQEQ
jgi:hypothetical protein